jgi:hypothetical protein
MVPFEETKRRMAKLKVSEQKSIITACKRLLQYYTKKTKGAEDHNLSTFCVFCSTCDPVDSKNTKLFGCESCPWKAVEGIHCAVWFVEAFPVYSLNHSISEVRMERQADFIALRVKMLQLWLPRLEEVVALLKQERKEARQC